MRPSPRLAVAWNHRIRPEMMTPCSFLVGTVVPLHCLIAPLTSLGLDTAGDTYVIPADRRLVRLRSPNDVEPGRP
jgi:hypothetical protein